jgi:hypothetical protein
MFGSLLDKTTSWLDQRLIATVLVPLVGFLTAVGALIASHFGWAPTIAHWRHLNSAEQTTVAVSVSIGLLLLTQVGAASLYSLIRLYEGYWMLRPWAAPLGRRRCGAHQRRWDSLVLTDPRDYQRRYREFPTRVDELLPTRFGNAIRAAESYARDKRRYGVDAVFFWPRLYSLLPDASRDSLSAARSSIEQLLFIAFLSSLLAVTSCVAPLVVRLSPVAWLPAGAGALAGALLAYRAAVSAAISYGELVRSAFDTHRLSLLVALGYALPASVEAERELWQAIGQLLYRRDAERPEVLKYHD